MVQFAKLVPVHDFGLKVFSGLALGFVLVHLWPAGHVLEPLDHGRVWHSWPSLGTPGFRAFGLEKAEPDVPEPKENLKWIATSDAKEAPRSKNGLNTQVIFENKSDQRVNVYWVSYGNELKLYEELDPGATHQQNTYSRNTWLITDTKDNPLGYFIVGVEVARAVIPKQKKEK